ncbi:hypothetical protein ACKLNR_005746 [Fusarium oxysporum f. sp. zingiberi]
MGMLDLGCFPGPLTASPPPFSIQQFHRCTSENEKHAVSAESSPRLLTMAAGHFLLIYQSLQRQNISPS